MLAHSVIKNANLSEEAKATIEASVTDFSYTQMKESMWRVYSRTFGAARSEQSNIKQEVCMYNRAPVEEVKLSVTREVEGVEGRSRLIGKDMVTNVNVKVVVTVTRTPLIQRREELSCVSTVKQMITCPDIAQSQNARV